MNMLEIAAVGVSVACVAIHVANGRKYPVVFLPCLVLLWGGLFLDQKGFHPESVSVLVRIAALLPGVLVVWDFLGEKSTSQNYPQPSHRKSNMREFF